MIRAEVIGKLGRIRLERPEALNALTFDMVTAIHTALDRFESDDAVRMVVLEGAGEKAFCAGGDVAAMHKLGREGRHDESAAFFATEYRMNARVASMSKPVLSLIHGFCMGGGVGVACHASHRVVCESARLAMPECAIGLVPDVGGSYLLANAPGRLGEYFGLTGARMSPGDAVTAGFADYYIPQSRWPALLAYLQVDPDPAAIARHAVAPPASELAPYFDEIDRAFALAPLEILPALDAGSDWAKAQAASIRKGSPISVLATLYIVRAVREAGTLEAAFDHELRYTARATTLTDFVEGVRAMLIDKDRKPVWKHGSLADVPQELLDKLTAPLTDKNATT